MSVERLRLILAAIWVFASLSIATGLRLSWTTGAVLLAFGVIPPIALFLLWNQRAPLFNKSSRDPRAS